MTEFPIDLLTFFDSSPDGILAFQADSRVLTYCNAAAEKLLGQTANTLKTVEVNGADTDLHPCAVKLTDSLNENINLALAKHAFRFEWNYTCPRQGSIYCDVSLTISNQGNTRFLICTLRGMSEQKKKLDDLRQANDRFNLVIKGSDVGIWQWDLASGELDWSDHLFKQLGYAPQEVTPSYEFWKQIIHPDDFDSVISALKAHIDHDTPYIIELRNKCKDGTYRWFKASGHARRNDEGEPVLMAGSMEDINKRKEAEIANSRLLELLDASSDFIGQADINKNLTYLNPAFKKLVGYGQKGRTDIPDWHPAEDLKKLDEVIFPQTLKNGSWRGEINFIDIDGNVVPCSLLELGHKNNKGEFETFSAIFRDISDLKQKEAEILKQTKISEHQSKLAAIGQLAAGVGHEINNPLAIAQGYIESTLTDLGAKESSDNPELSKKLEKVNTALVRIAQITTGLRSFARTESNNTEYTCVGEVLQEAFSLVSEIYINDGIEFQIDKLTDFDNTYICADRGKFQQVVLNILSNARDALENANIKRISVQLKKRDGLVTIRFEDSGEGIPDAIKQKIFDPFYTTKDVNKGTGLGLSFVREYIEAMNGTIDVSSEVGKTRFVIHLPEATRHTTDVCKQPISPSKSATNRHLKILIVEDEELLCEYYTNLLESEGHQLEIAHNGKDALTKIENLNVEFDLILSDMRMPEMDGLELAEQIKKQGLLPGPKFLLTTGGVDINLESMEPDLHALIDGYLLKPFKGDVLLSTIDRLCSGDEQV